MRIPWLTTVVGCLFLSAAAVSGARLPAIQTVFVIVLENTSWSAVKGNPSAPFLNHVLLPGSAYCEHYFTPPNNHPSLPNYLWLEAGTNLGVLNDNSPAVNHVNTSNHLVSQMDLAGVSWRAYAEDIDGKSVPLQNTNNYAVRHNPFVYFDDVTGTNDPENAYAIAHIRPFPELAGDLASNQVARYNFIIPNLVDDGHNAVPPATNAVQQVDEWLSVQVPLILDSAAYLNDGALFILWDEGAAGSDGPIGLLLLSPQGRGGGFASTIRHTHSDTVRTWQEIFGLQPWLGNAAHSADLSELFNMYSFKSVTLGPDLNVQLILGGVEAGQTNVLQASADLMNWFDVSTNVAVTNQLVFRVACSNTVANFYRAYSLP